MATAGTMFSGFRPEALEFLSELAENNDRSWFQPRKADYERLLKQPLEALCVTLAERFASRGLPMVADAAKSPFRIYRDVRFAKDNTPYKTNVGASFPWVGDRSPSDVDAAERAHGSGGYFHFQPGEIFVGGGMWHPEPARLAAWRKIVLNEPERIRAVIDEPRFAGEFGSVRGDALKRVPTGFPADHPEAELLKLKDVTFGRRLSDDEGLSPELPEIVCDSFVAAAPVFRLLADLEG